jgi:AAA15 family ATPase/GTPase
MLSSFFIQNFRSILKLKLDFSYGEGKAPNWYKEGANIPFLEGENGQRIVPCSAFFGANASGKSNIVKAFVAFKHLLKSDGDNLASLYEPNLLNPKFANTKFGIEFVLGRIVFEYWITYDANEIIEEVFKKNGEQLYAIRHLVAEFSPNIISDTYSKDKLNDILRVECSKGEGQQTKTFLNRIGHGYSGLNDDLKNVYFYLRNRLHVSTNTDTLLLPLSVEILASVFGRDESLALREITGFVRQLDVDINSIGISQRQLAPNEQPSTGITRENRLTGAKHALYITATHNNVEGNPVFLDFIRNESEGTQRLAGLAGMILHAIKTGGVLVLDELDRSLHPLLVREIVTYFKKRRCNPKGAQLIFTTHNTDILDDSILRLSEIALVRKTTPNGTMVRRLIDAKNEGEDIRNVTNFRKQYLAGYYAAIPHPAL